MAKSVLHLDLHPIAKRGAAIDEALFDIIEQALQRKAKVVEIIPGKGTGQLKKRVVKFLNRKDVKAQYERVQVDPKNHGRIFVYFSHR